MRISCQDRQEQEQTKHDAMMMSKFAYTGWMVMVVICMCVSVVAGEMLYRVCLRRGGMLAELDESQEMRTSDYKLTNGVTGNILLLTRWLERGNNNTSRCEGENMMRKVSPFSIAVLSNCIARLICGVNNEGRVSYLAADEPGWTDLAATMCHGETEITNASMHNYRWNKGHESSARELSSRDHMVDTRRLRLRRRVSRVTSKESSRIFYGR
eukprot:scaffold42455_cov79-Cyclotella_meneghiniana.AAC.2